MTQQFKKDPTDSISILIDPSRNAILGHCKCGEIYDIPLNSSGKKCRKCGKEIKIVR